MSKQNRKWCVVTIESTPAVLDAVSNWFFEMNSSGIEEGENFRRAYFPEDQWNTTVEYAFDKYLEELTDLGMINKKPEVIYDTVSEDTWAENWKDFFKPKKIGEKFIVLPPWEKNADDDSRIKIIIEPGMAFGTGIHETTESVMVLLEKHIKSGYHIWDAGTGTGILAIAALKLGASTAYTNDIEEESFDAVKVNTNINNLHGRIEVELLDLNEVKHEKFDLITANLFRNLLIDTVNKFHSCLKDEGVLVISGLETIDVPKIVSAYTEKGLFSLLERLDIGEWTGLAFKKE